MAEKPRSQKPRRAPENVPTSPPPPRAEASPSELTSGPVGEAGAPQISQDRDARIRMENALYEAGLDEANRQHWYQEVARRAFEIYQNEGRPEGRDAEHWHRAAAELRAERAATEKLTGSTTPGQRAA